MADCLELDMDMSERDCLHLSIYILRCDCTPLSLLILPIPLVIRVALEQVEVFAFRVTTMYSANGQHWLDVIRIVDMSRSVHRVVVLRLRVGVQI